VNIPVDRIPADGIPRPTILGHGVVATVIEGARDGLGPATRARAIPGLVEGVGTAWPFHKYGMNGAPTSSSTRVS